MSDNSSKNKRIAKNSLMLYIRMLLMTVVLFYTSRVMLKALGVADFGVYNIVGGIIVLFSFLNNTMTSSIQRFLNFLLGKNDLDKVKKVFVQSIVISYIFAGVFLLLSESIGLYYVIEFLNVPSDREYAALIVYQLSVIGAIFMIVRIPYVATVISYERMGTYAVLSIIDTILKLVIVWLLFLFPYDRLITYGALLCLINLITTIFYSVYCINHFNIVSHRLFIDTTLLKQLSSFTGWNLLGSTSSVISTQGIGILLNLFYGVMANAAMGIANQVLSGIYNIAASFTNAFNPVLVKSYAEGDVPYYTNLLNKTSRLTFCLMWVVCLPCIVWCEFLLKIWLGDIPQYSVEFCRLMIVYALLEGVSAPLWMIAQAEGNVKKYQIIISSLTLFSLLLGYILMLIIDNPISLLLSRLFVSFLIYIYRVYYVNQKFAFSIRLFLYEFVRPTAMIILLSSLFAYLSYSMAFDRFLSLILCITMTGILVLSVGLSRREIIKLNNAIKTKIRLQ